MKFNRVESEILDQLVLDCNRFRLSEQESLLYIELRFNKKVNRDTYFSRKRRLVSDPYIQKWFNNFADVGYALKQVRVLEDLESTLGILQKELYYCSITKPVDRKALAMLAGEINEITKQFRTVLLDAPFVSALKSELDRLKLISGKSSGDKYLKGLEDRSHSPETSGNIPATEPVTTSSALIIPIDSIAGKPQESTAEEREADKPVF